MTHFTWTPDAERLIRVRSATHTAKMVADILGVTRGQVRERARKLGISFRKYGESHHSSKVSDSDIELIRSLHDEGLSIGEICDKFEMSVSFVGQICGYKFRVKG